MSDSEDQKGETLLPRLIEMKLLTLDRFEELSAELSNFPIETLIPNLTTLQDERVYYYIAAAKDINDVRVGPQKLSLLRLSFDLEDTLFTSIALDLGADEEDHTVFNDSLLNIALLKGDWIVAKMLIVSGSDITRRIASTGALPITEAIRSNDIELLQMFFDYPYASIQKMDEVPISKNVLDYMSFSPDDLFALRQNLFLCTSDVWGYLRHVGLDLSDITEISHPIGDHLLIASGLPDGRGILPLTVDTRVVDLFKTVNDKGEDTFDYNVRGSKYELDLINAKKVIAQATENKSETASSITHTEDGKVLLLDKMTKVHADLNLEYIQQYFVNGNIDVNAQDKDGRNIMMYLVRYPEILKAFMDKFSDRLNFNQMDNNGRTLLTYLYSSNADIGLITEIVLKCKYTVKDIIYGLFSSDLVVTHGQQHVWAIFCSLNDIIREGFIDSYTKENNISPPFSPEVSQLLENLTLQATTTLLMTGCDYDNSNFSKKIENDKKLFLSGISIEKQPLVAAKNFSPFDWVCTLYSDPNLLQTLIHNGAVSHTHKDSNGFSALERLFSYNSSGMTDVDLQAQILTLVAICTEEVVNGHYKSISISQVVDINGKPITNEPFLNQCNRVLSVVMEGVQENLYLFVEHNRTIKKSDKILDIRVCTQISPCFMHVPTIDIDVEKQDTIYSSFPYKDLYHIWLSAHKNIDKLLLITGGNDYKFALEHVLARQIYAFANNIDVNLVVESDDQSEEKHTVTKAVQLYRSVMSEVVNQQFSRIDQGLDALTLSIRALSGDSEALNYIQKMNLVNDDTNVTSTSTINTGINANTNTVGDSILDDQKRSFSTVRGNSKKGIMNNAFSSGMFNKNYVSKTSLIGRNMHTQSAQIMKVAGKVMVKMVTKSPM